MKKLKIFVSVLIAMISGVGAIAHNNVFNTTAYYTFTNGVFHLIGTTFDSNYCVVTPDTNCAYTVVITGFSSPVNSFLYGSRPANYSVPIGNDIRRHYYRESN